MSKKNSNVILKDGFKNFRELHNIKISFTKKIKSFKKKIFLIAVSGGPDSLALAALAKSYSYSAKCKFYYVLVDHNIRKNSSNEAIQVKKLLKKNKINLIILKNKKKIKSNIQGAAREIRYKLLTNYCKKRNIPTVVTAHNLEDQVETFFMRLSRGSGLQGLSSMQQISKIEKINLFRPLLDCKKLNLVKISKIIYGSFFRDPSNKNNKFLRIKIRKLKKNLENSGISYEQIIKSINNLASSRDTLNLYFNKIYQDLVRKKKGKHFINFKGFESLNQETKIMVLKKSIKDISNSYYSTRSKKIIRLIDKISLLEEQKYTLGGCLILRKNVHLILQKENKN